ncbi:hypothetical protein [Rhodoferax mekongensis]|uniref:Replicative helicase inhibitor G39P N-terminal domain-containing protein n=1 Tax=Rhodoferax mekongensis TaxID=3068341 RepID=A0ABZ0B585_9BURK|nr:hypothetical protein [Rhodoferax sp. TBRC 17307]WNO06032.1 hypothetical protein RAN89_06270 [Rhodoferax sp. TBRC 17307]
MIEFSGTTPIAAVDYVFKVMFATYGAGWSRSIGDAPIADVKTVWGQVLADYVPNSETADPEATRRPVIWALNNLPEFVPNARQFKALLRSAPSKPAPQLPAPTVNPEIAARVLDGLRANPKRGYDHKGWAHRILDRKKAGDKVSPTVVAMANRALGVEA